MIDEISLQNVTLRQGMHILTIKHLRNTINKTFNGKCKNFLEFKAFTFYRSDILLTTPNHPGYY